MWPVSSVEIIGEQEKIVEVGNEVFIELQVKSLGNRVGDHKLVKFHSKNQFGKIQQVEMASDQDGKLINIWKAEKIGEEEIEIQSGFTSRIVSIKVMPKDSVPVHLSFKKIKNSDYFYIQGFNKKGEEVYLSQNQSMKFGEKISSKIKSFQKGFLVNFENLKSIQDKITIKYYQLQQIIDLKKIDFIEVNRLPANWD